jgi:hypothetical protein
VTLRVDSYITKYITKPSVRSLSVSCCRFRGGAGVQLAVSLSTWGRSLRACRAAPIQADNRLTLELNCQSEDVKSYRRSKRDGGKG